MGEKRKEGKKIKESVGSGNTPTRDYSGGTATHIIHPRVAGFK